MNTFEARYYAPQSTTEVWKALNKPLKARTANWVHSDVIMRYSGLQRDRTIGSGSHIGYVLKKQTVARQSMIPKSLLPDDVEFVVEQFDPGHRQRTDRLVGGRAEGFIAYTIEPSAPGSQIVVQSALELNKVKLGLMATLIGDDFLRTGVDHLLKRFVEHIPLILEQP